MDEILSGGENIAQASMEPPWENQVAEEDCQMPSWGAGRLLTSGDSLVDLVEEVWHPLTMSWGWRGGQGLEVPGGARAVEQLVVQHLKYDSVTYF